MPDFSSLSASYLFASLIWGSVGSVMLMYGWKQKIMLPLWTGLGLVAVTYFVSSAVLMSVESIAILLLAYFLKRRGME